MGMPPGHAERNAFVEIVLVRPFRRRVHGAFKLISVRCFLIKEGCRLPGMKTKRRFETSPLAGEVVVRLRHVRQKRLIAVLDGLPIVSIGFQGLPERHDNLSRPLVIGWIGRSRLSPPEMGSHVRVGLRHGGDGFLSVPFMQSAVLRLVEGV